MGKLEGRTAFITGLARGQGRSHAIRLAEEGADIIGVDACEQFDVVGYPLATPEDLQLTIKEIEARGRRIVARQADVRDLAAMQAVYDEGVAALGPVTIAVANAGIGPGGEVADEQVWNDIVAVNMTGVWNTVRLVLQPMIDHGTGGSIILTSSTGGLVGPGLNHPGMLAYVAAKHGVIGLMRAYANIAAQHSIRVNSVAPTTVNTPMSEGLEESLQFAPDLARALENALPVFKVEPQDISNAVAWLASDEARFVTGSVIAVDAGNVNRK